MTLCFLFERKWLQGNREIHVVQQSKKMIQFITCKTTFGQRVCELVLGVNKFDLDLGVQVNSVKQPIKRNSVGSGYVSHGWTSALNDHFGHCFVIFKDVQLRLTLRKVCVCGYVVHMRQLINISVSLFVWVWNCDLASSFLLHHGLVIRHSSRILYPRCFVS